VDRGGYGPGLGLWGDPEVTALIGGPFSRERVKDRLVREIKSGKADNIQYWPLFLLETGEFIGACGLRLYKPEKKIYEFGFYLKKPFRGRGYAAEAGRVVITRAFKELGAELIGAGHHPENAASKKTLLKLGFVYLKDELYPPTGLRHPFYELKKRG